MTQCVARPELPLADSQSSQFLTFRGFIALSKAISPRLRTGSITRRSPSRLHDDFIARELELHGNADRLVAAVSEQFDVPPFRHELTSRAWRNDICRGAIELKRAASAPAAATPLLRRVIT